MPAEVTDAAKKELRELNIPKGSSESRFFWHRIRGTAKKQADPARYRREVRRLDAQAGQIPMIKAFEVVVKLANQRQSAAPTPQPH
jgi:hypothetical protein